jgi:hypothetical protein
MKQFLSIHWKTYFVSKIRFLIAVVKVFLVLCLAMSNISLLALNTRRLLMEFFLFVIRFSNLLPLKLSRFFYYDIAQTFRYYFFSHLHMIFDSWIFNSSSSFRILYFLSLLRVWECLLPIFDHVLDNNFVKGFKLQIFAPPQTGRQ